MNTRKIFLLLLLAIFIQTNSYSDNHDKAANASVESAQKTVLDLQESIEKKNTEIDKLVKETASLKEGKRIFSKEDDSA